MHAETKIAQIHGILNVTNYREFLNLGITLYRTVNMNHLVKVS